jgi:hypothetical protein
MQLASFFFFPSQTQPLSYSDAPPPPATEALLFFAGVLGRRVRKNGEGDHLTNR